MFFIRGLRLAIDAGRAESGADDEHIATIRSVRDGLIRLSEDVHALSYRLHPSILDDLGLVEALKAECKLFSRLEAIPLNLVLQEDIQAPPVVALCIFRIAQESLRNIARHAKATKIEVSMQHLDGAIQLRVSDDGIGFDPKQRRDVPSLGVASMQQRAAALGGHLRVESASERGTTVSAIVPIREECNEPPARAVG